MDRGEGRGERRKGRKQKNRKDGRVTNRIWSKKTLERPVNQSRAERGRKRKITRRKEKLLTTSCLE